MKRLTPPFRADMVGSLLRTRALKEARQKHQAGELSAEGLKAVEDEEIRALIRKQEEIGLQAVTDGEFRRAFWHFDFLEQLDGVTSVTADSGMNFKGGVGIAKALRITGKVGFSGHPMVDHFRFVKDNTSRVAKMTIPGPSMLHYRGGRKMMNPGIYPDMDGFYADVGAAYGKAVHAFYDAGCRYLQLDDISFAYLCDPEQRQMLKDRGDDPAQQPQIYAGMVREALKDKPPTSRSRCTCAAATSARRSSRPAATSPSPTCCSTPCPSTATSWSGTATAPAASSRCASCPRARRWCSASSPPRPARSKARTPSGAASTRPSKFVDLDQLCLSPQCGFASTEEGNVLAEDEQWAKLRMIVEVAQEVWG